MNATDYQHAAARTLISAPDHPFTATELMLMWSALGLGGESGEVLDHLKKTICHQHGDVLSVDSREKLEKELGDVLWYVAAIASLIGADLGVIMRANIDKLLARYPNGYNAAESIARVDTQPDLPVPAIGERYKL